MYRDYPLIHTRNAALETFAGAVPGYARRAGPRRRAGARGGQGNGEEGVAGVSVTPGLGCARSTKAEGEAEIARFTP